MFEQNEIISKKQELFKKNQTEILDLKSTATEKKNSLTGFDSRFKQVEENYQ